MKKQNYLSPMIMLTKLPSQDIVMSSLQLQEVGMGDMIDFDDFINPKA